MPVPANTPVAPSAAAMARNQARGPNPYAQPLLRTAASNAANQTPNTGALMPPSSYGRGASSTGASQSGKMSVTGSQIPTGPANGPTSTPATATTQAILQAPVWNPSMAPSASIMPSSTQKIPTGPPVVMSNMSQAQPLYANAVAKTYNRGPKDFKLGEIISVPFHEGNTNPHLQPTDYRLRLTWKGPVFTKRRMLVVLWSYRRGMFCLPLYSFEGKGLRSRSPFIKPEYVCLKNVDAKNFVNQGSYNPVVATWINKPFSDDTTVHITGGIKVSCIEDIAFCGRLDEWSYGHLLKLWEGQTQLARRRRYEP